MQTLISERIEAVYIHADLCSVRNGSCVHADLCAWSREESVYMDTASIPHATASILAHAQCSSGERTHVYLLLYIYLS